MRRVQTKPLHWLIITALVCLSAVFSGRASGSPPATPEGDRALRLESVEIHGNDRTPESIVLGHLQLEPGDGITPGALEAARQRVLDTGYFLSADFSTRPGSRRGAVVLVIEIKERGFPGFETGFGYHDLYGWFLTLGGLRFDNLFGIESRLKIGLRLGWRLGGLDAEWSQPLSRDGYYSLTARGYIYNINQRFYHAVPDTGSGPPPGDADRQPFQQQIQRAGSEISFDVGRRRSARFSFGLRVESIDPDSTFTNTDTENERGYHDMPASLAGSIDRVVQSGLFMRVIHDTRDGPQYLSSGTHARFSLVSNNTWLGGDQLFTRAELDASAHKSIRDSGVLSYRLAGGITTSGTPHYDKFYLGGIYSIRGFAEQSLSDPDGNDGYWLTNLELRWRLAGGTQRRPRVIGLAFVDAGQPYERNAPLDADDIQVGAGWGLRFRIPWAGTLGFDAGIPLTDGRTDDPFRVHFSIGFSF